jgi:hypothetical protein
MPSEWRARRFCPVYSSKTSEKARDGYRKGARPEALNPISENRRVDLDLLVRQRVRRRSGRVGLADIVHPNVPFETGTTKHVREPPGCVVLLEDGHAPLPARSGQEARSPQPTDAGADHNRVEPSGLVKLLVGRAK